MKRVLIIGGVAAGTKAAATARRRNPNLDIVVIHDEAEASYSACGLPYHLSDSNVIPRAKLIARSVSRFREDGIDFRALHRVETVDLAARRALISETTSGREYHEPFDQVLFATGAAAIMPPIPVSDAAPPVMPLRSLAEADRLRDLIPSTRCVAIVGGGYIGLEMAETFRHRGLSVTLIEALPRLLSAFDPAIGEAVGAHLVAKGIALRLGVGAAEVLEGGIRLEDGQFVEADLVLMAVGVRPSVDLAVAAGVELGVTGAIAVDEGMRCSGLEGVYAAGDCAEALHVVSRKPVWYPLGDIANRQGRVAGINIAGGRARFPGVLGTAIFRAFDLAVARTGLTPQQASDAGFEPLRVQIQAPSRARYMPLSRPLDAILITDRHSGRVLGGEAVGPDGVDKYIDVVAAAVWAGLTADDLAELDLAYAPPYAPVFAPVQVVAQATRTKVESTPPDMVT